MSLKRIMKDFLRGEILYFTKKERNDLIKNLNNPKPNNQTKKKKFVYKQSRLKVDNKKKSLF
jgi:hypothetical protein